MHNRYPRYIPSLLNPLMWAIDVHPKLDNVGYRNRGVCHGRGHAARWRSGPEQAGWGAGHASAFAP